MSSGAPEVVSTTTGMVLRLGSLLEDGQQLPAVHPGHVQVQHDQVGPRVGRVAQVLEGVDAVARPGGRLRVMPRSSSASSISSASAGSSSTSSTW